MRGETWVSMAACSGGMAVPVVTLGPHAIGGIGTPLLVIGSVVVATPLAVVAATAWVVRADRRTARVVAVVSLLAFAVGLAGWWAAERDPEGFALLVVGLVFVPGAQLFVWLAGAVVSGRLGRA